MPCNDTTSRIVVHLDLQDRLIDFEYTKITCDKAIVSNAGYQDYCVGKSIEEILAIDFSQLLGELKPASKDEEFLLFLEWDALRAALLQYIGGDEHLDREKYQIAAISYDADRIEIRQVILPPKDMPEIIPCHLARKS